MKRRAKIVATLGPASRSKHAMQALIQAGMNVARLNFSHGTHADHAKTIALLRETAERLGKPVAIMIDLQGPKIRTGDIPGGSVSLRAGESLTLTTRAEPGEPSHIPVDLPELPIYVRPGSRILLADGHMELAVRSTAGPEIVTEIILGGTLKSNQGLNLPGVRLDIPGFTQKDELDLEFGLKQQVDLIAISFVRTAGDVARLRSAIARLSPGETRVPVIAKLERPEALDNLEEIIRAADGVMVARGDLGVEMPPEEVPIAQKRIIESANRNSKVVITATQMLESMIDNPRPTRAEASDVANAIFDGTDAVMLSGETAVGEHPVDALRMMDAIICQAEGHLHEYGHWKGLPEEAAAHSDAIYLCRAAAALAQDRHVAGIAVFTKTGNTTLQMSKARPNVPILGFTSDERAYRRMSMFWGVVPHLVPVADTMEALIDHVEIGLLAETPVQRGQQVVLICGFPVDQMRPSNLVMLHTVGQNP
jgi:pyruvate kinase